MNEPTETKDYKGYKIKILDDYDSCHDPRDWGWSDQMVCWHRDYNLGDKHDFSSPEDFMEFVKEQGNDIFYLPLYLYDHSGITINTTGFSCRWDSGQVGWIYITKEGVRKDIDSTWKVFTKKRRERVYDHLRGIVETYDHYITGNIYGFIVEDNKGEHVDSCWGFFGYDHEKSGLLENAKSSIDYEIQRVRKERLEKVKTMIKNKVPLNKREQLLGVSV